MDNHKKIIKLERRIDKLIQKLEHIHREMRDLKDKSKIKPLRKKQEWHLTKLYKVQEYYLSEIHHMTVEIINIKCLMDGGYSSESNPLEYGKRDSEEWDL